jgi:hypothetical protein
MDNTTPESTPTVTPAPASTDYQNKLTEIESQIAGIRTSAANIADQQNKPQLASDIRAGRPSDPNTLSVGNSSNNTIIDPSQFAKPDAAHAAIASIGSKTNNLPQLPKDGDWQSVVDLKQSLLQDNSFSQENKLKQEYQDLGITANIDLLNSITTQGISQKAEWDKLDTAENDAINNLSNNPELTKGDLNSLTLRIQNDYNKRKAPLAASLASMQSQAAMIQGNINLAKGYASDLVSAATYDAEQKSKQIDAVGQYYGDILSSMGADYQTAYLSAKDRAKAEYDQQTKEKTQIVDWATSPTTAAALLGTDLSTISFEDASKKVRDYVGTKIPASSTNNDNSRVNTVKAFINKNAGGDGKISWETYSDAAQKYIALGGSTSDFKVAFPAERFLDAGNQSALPASLKPASAGAAADFYSNL